MRAWQNEQSPKPLAHACVHALVRGGSPQEILVSLPIDQTTVYL